MLKALIYDFDGTLTPDVRPQFAILEKAGLENGCDNPKFFEEVHKLAKQDNIDTYDAMIRHILAIIKKGGYAATDENISLGADSRTYRPGVEAFLQKYKQLGIKNYLLSSGSKTYLEHTKIAPYFTEIYGSTLNYNNQGEATEPAHVMTTEAKIDSLKEIAKSHNGSVEDCTGLLYIGDGPTDIPVMTYAKEHGGITIMLRDDNTIAEITKLSNGANTDNIVTHYFPADFREGSELDDFVGVISE